MVRDADNSDANADEPEECSRDAGPDEQRMSTTGHRPPAASQTQQQLQMDQLDGSTITVTLGPAQKV